MYVDTTYSLLLTPIDTSQQEQRIPYPPHHLRSASWAALKTALISCHPSSQLDSSCQLAVRKQSTQKLLTKVA